MKVEIQIDQLVLHGFAPGDRHRIGAALEQELARLVAERGVPRPLTGPAAVRRLDAGSFVAAPGGGRGVATSIAAGIAAGIAERVYQGLAQHQSPGTSMRDPQSTPGAERR